LEIPGLITASSPVAPSHGIYAIYGVYVKSALGHSATISFHLLVNRQRHRGGARGGCPSGEGALQKCRRHFAPGCITQRAKKVDILKREEKIKLVGHFGYPPQKYIPPNSTIFS